MQKIYNFANSHPKTAAAIGIALAEVALNIAILIA